LTRLLLYDVYAKIPSESACHSESRDNAGRRISFFKQVVRSFAEVYPEPKTEILRFAQDDSLGLFARLLIYGPQ